eukprot:s78_g5.t1
MLGSSQNMLANSASTTSQCHWTRIFAPGQAPRVAAAKGAGAAPSKAAQEAPKAAPKAPQAAPKKDAVPKAAEPTAQEPKAATPPASKEEEPCKQEAGPLAVGSVVRICGLKSAPQLNGTIAEVLRAGDVPDRIIVRCPGAGEKALRVSNLLASATDVLPPWAGPVLAVLAVSSILAALGLYRDPASCICSTVVPGLAALVLLVTVLVCLLLYRPCWPPNCWLPSVSEVVNRSPSRTIFRSGMLLAALLLLVSNWLYGQLVLAQILDGPIRLPPSAPDGVKAFPPNVLEDDGAVLEDEDLAETSPKDKVLPEVVQSAQSESVAEEALNASAESSENETENSTVVKKPRIPSPSLLRSSLLYGYVAPAALAAQAVFFSGRWLPTILHVIAALAFALASSQHTSGSGLLLTSARGRPYADLMGELHVVAQARQMMADFAPIIAMGVPVTAQVFNTSRLAQQRGSLTAMGFLETSGILLQRGAVGDDPDLRTLRWQLRCRFLGTQPGWRAWGRGASLSRAPLGLPGPGGLPAHHDAPRILVNVRDTCSDKRERHGIEVFVRGKMLPSVSAMAPASTEASLGL